ncbi:MAG: SOS response-associated peptidase [Gammaproteobacteria bacterium]|nr:SOS response-associated peptidase [Gammaproteobacteria bacterium]
MCGRFTRTSTIETFAHLFDAIPTVDLQPSYNIAPTQNILAARRTKKGGRELVALHWGLVPHCSKGPNPKYSMINARADSITTKPAYRDSFKRRRCLIATDGFYEWKKLDKIKQPYFISMTSGKPFAFAGIWDRWEAEGQEPIESCSILPVRPTSW